MPVERPDRFDIKDLYLDVRLEAIIDGQSHDFTGRKYFTTGFFKENIGFGITDVRIEVNTSLQPLVEITLMDLYGNTMFGGKYNSQGVDHSGFFNWPPPKFMFTFKGYLGRPVTMMLSLKSYDINFISSSGHYEIKASFIPNQWGFFADIPFLFLVAAKRLRMRQGQTQEDAMSIYDLIDMGRKVEVKNTEVTQKYNSLLHQMNSMYKDISRSILDNIVYFDKEIDGRVDGRGVKDFQRIFIGDVEKGPGAISKVDIGVYQNKSSEQNLMNQFLFTKVKVNGATGKHFAKTIEEFKELDFSQKNEDMAKCVEAIRKNIDAINKEVVAETYDVAKEMIGKITIGELFRQIAKDTAYIMGRILEAGFKGNSGTRADIRKREIDSTKPNIVGKYYPLTNSKEKDGEEAPATEGHAGTDYGVNDVGCEMEFVREFIEAVVDGIANDVQAEAENTSISEDTLVFRISNLEAVVNTNPYKPFFLSIAENILVRSGIGAFMIRSNDPNTPGGYSSGPIESVINEKGDSANNIKKLAESDAGNITDSIIKSMDVTELGLLREFVTFFDKLLSDDGEDFLNSEGKNADFLSDGTLGYGGNLSDVDEPISSDILDYKVVMDMPDSISASILNTQAKIVANQNVDGIKLKSLRMVLKEGGFNTLKGMVNMETLMSRKLTNNSLPYVFPMNTRQGNFFLALQGDDMAKFKSRTTSPTDSEFNSSEIDKDEAGAKGFIEIAEYSDADGDVFGRVERFNVFTSGGAVFDYAAVKSINSEFRNSGTYGDAEGDDISGTNDMPADIRSMLWSKQVTNAEPGDDLRLIKPGNLGYVALYGTDDSKSRLVFGPFLKGQKGRNQRIYIKTMCVEVLKKIDQKERNAQAVVSKLLGKANEQENTIYKQFHTLFHQWSSMAYNDSISNTGSFNGSSLPMNGEGIANRLEQLYGGSNSHVTIGGRSAESVQDLPDTTFIYDYPLQRIKEMNGDNIIPIDVKNSIINMEPMNKPDQNTTVLNMLYSLCSKNNFMFLPIPGYAGYLDVKNVYKPYMGEAETRVRNYFHIMFMPTPESRPLLSNDTFSSSISFQDSDIQKGIKGSAIGLSYGATDNQVIRNLSVGTKDNKVTAESIINLQRLTDNEDQNRTVTRDCSMLNVMAGRSYTSKVDTLGNAQIYPMQFFFLDKMPLFDGLYQIMKVEHTIKPNDMTTTFEGIRMRFNPGSGYFSIPPVTLETMQQLSEERPQPVEVEQLQFGEFNPLEGIGTEKSSGDPVGMDELKRLYQNGRIPASALSSSGWLKRLDISKVALLAKEAAESFEKMMSDFDMSQFQWKQKLVVTSSYRSYQRQVELAGPNAAKPGTSKHGWGVAVDFSWGLKIKNNKDPEFLKAAFAHPNYRWFFQNGHKYGWYNPANLRDGSKLEEWWHWEYHGLNGPPQPLLSEYAGGFGQDSIAYIRSKQGCQFIA